MARRGRKPRPYLPPVPNYPWGARREPLPLVLEGIIMLLPAGGASITEADLERWLSGFRSAAHLVYQVEETPMHQSPNASESAESEA